MTSSPTPGSGRPPGQHGPDGDGAAPSWWIYRGTGRPATYSTDLAERLPDPPPWRRFTGGPDQPDPPADDGETERILGATTLPGRHPLSGPETAVVDAVNTALLLRRPLLVTGAPGVGKSSLATTSAVSSVWGASCGGPSPAAAPCARGCTSTTPSPGSTTFPPTPPRPPTPSARRSAPSATTCASARWAPPCCRTGSPVCW